MIDIAIVGGGLCGLALAHRLKSVGKDVQVFEARPTLGGRVRTVYDKTHGIALDLGPTWFWPEEQPLMASLVTMLDLETYPQHDTGKVLGLMDLEKGPEILGTNPIHAGAHRVSGGMARVIDGLVARLGDTPIRVNHQLTTLKDAEDHVCLRFEADNGEAVVHARQVVLAMPPRLLIETIAVVPAWPERLQNAMKQAETWMAVQAKAILTYASAGWRDDGVSGNAFVRHERAALAEIFDLSMPDGAPAALGGFLAMDPQTRASFSAGMETLVKNQMGQIFGPAYERGPFYYMDWAQERFTCSGLDKTAPTATERAPANPLLRRALWDQKVFFAGTEIAAAHAGHMEGALQSAHRIAVQLSRSRHAGALQISDWGEVLEWLTTQAEPAFETYLETLNRSLSHQDPYGVTRQALGEAIASLFDGLLDALNAVEFKPHAIADKPARSLLLEELKPFVRDALNRLIIRVIDFNRSSCALRNFPQEHALSEDYIRQMLQDASQLGRLFFNEADALFAANVEAA